MQFNEWLSILSLISAFASPIIVAYIGIRGERNNKNNEKIRKLQEEKNEREKQDLQEQLKSINDSITSIKGDVKSIKGDIRTIRDHDDKQDEEIAKINKATRLNGMYTHELAQLVMVLSEGMRDQHLDGNITKAITHYQQFENNALKSMITGDGPEDK